MPRNVKKIAPTCNNIGGKKYINFKLVTFINFLCMFLQCFFI